MLSLKVQSVERCTVHYEDTLHAVVDVNIKLESESATVTEAMETAKDVKSILEMSDNIHKANIYLDLNER